MNKAFTKESDDNLEEIVPEPKDLLPPGIKNYVTPQGAEMLRAELKQLVEVERPRVVESGTGAAGPEADRSVAKRKRLQAIDRKIQFLRDQVASMEVVDSRAQAGDRVRFGATVQVMDEEGKTKTYQIVGIDEADPAAGKVSWLSPIAKALLGAEEGDAIRLRLPKGDAELEILAVEYPSPPE